MYIFTLCPPDAVSDFADALDAIGNTVGEVNFSQTIQEACLNQQAFFLPSRKARLY